MKSILYGIVLFAFSGSLFARLNIEITQGEVGGIPIAVVPRDASSASFELLAGVIRQDLKMCGRFQPVAVKTATTSPEHDLALWQSLRVENVVVGALKPDGPDTFEVTFQLWDVYRMEGKQKGSAVLLSKTYRGISNTHFRALAHQISDDIYAQLTGIRGAFSTRIAYVMVLSPGRFYQLEVADADGHNPLTLVRSKEPIMSPAWSPDGKKIAFVSFEKHRAEVYVVEVATGRRQLLSRFPGINGAPAWSPDGRTLAVVLSKDGSPKIYLFDLVSQRITPLTQGYSIDTEPVWSKDGQWVYFTSNRGGSPQIYRVALQSRRVERVTFEGTYNARPMLTADNKYLVMMHREKGQSFFHIASQELATGKVRLLTHAVFDESPTLSPNGAMVLYGTQHGDRQVLGLVTLEGRGQLRLPAREGSVQEPAWSPFLS